MKIIIASSSIVLGYLIGAIPIGFLVARAKGIADITQHGSGNIGATNVARSLGLFYFFVVFLFDAAKAFLFLYVLQFFEINEIVQIIAACSMLIGNGYSIFLHGRGGKGVATSVGILLFFVPYLTMILLGIWSTIVVITQTVGIASVVTLISLPFVLLATKYYNAAMLLLMIFISAWGILRHGDNIKNFFGRAAQG